MNRFEHSFAVEEGDLDPIGHVNNISYVRWIQDVAVAHSAAVGFDFDTYKKVGAIFMVRRHEVDYLRPVQLGQRVVARTWVTDAAGAKCHRHTEIRTADSDHPAVRGLTTWVFVGINTGRPTRIPPELFQAFGMSPTGFHPPKP
jgi:acyl-CoA thioester hydrolase